MSKPLDTPEAVLDALQKRLVSLGEHYITLGMHDAFQTVQVVDRTLWALRNRVENQRAAVENKALRQYVATLEDQLASQRAGESVDEE